MQLQEKFGNQVVAISLNVDFEAGTEGPADELKSKVLSVLTKMGIACENVMASEPMDEVLESFGIFSLPAVLIYNSQGELHKLFDGSVSYQEQVLPELEQLLSSRS